MANYVQSTNFATKDALPSGDPLKIVRGTEINTEFNNIATAVATKADLVSPTFSGTVTAPVVVGNVTGVVAASAGSTAVTQAFGNSSTLLSTTAFVQAALQALHPIGSIYINATNATNPGTLLGFGTWVAFGAGRVPVGFNAADPLFDTAEEIGGSKDTTLPSHTHGISGSGTTGNQSADHVHGFSGSTGGQSANHNHAISISDPGHFHSLSFIAPDNQGGGKAAFTNFDNFGDAGRVTDAKTTGITASSADASSDHAHSFSGNTGGISANHNHSFAFSGTSAAAGASPTNTNLQPYITVFMFKRTA